MRKKEFLRQLNHRLRHLNRDERYDIMDYYDELIEDTIERTGKSEGEVIYDLGDLEDIVRRVDPTRGEKIHYDEEPLERNERNRRRQDNYREPKKRSVIAIILMICLFPFYLGAIFAIVGIMIGLVCAGIGIGAGGIFSIIYGSSIFKEGFTMSIFHIGTGILLIGLDLIIIPLIIKIINFIGKIVLGFFKWLFGGNKRRRYAYEN